MSSFSVRRARTSDVKSIRNLVRPLAEGRVLLEKEAVAYYENLQEFFVAQDESGAVIGCGGLHVMWEDIAEVRTLPPMAPGVARAWGTSLGPAALEAQELGVERVFCLTFEVDFFKRHGFSIMEEQSAVDPEAYSELLRSTDEGVAEFLDLARVKPNTLGNTRIIIRF